ncbi:type II secretion system F family protein [Oricola cellulosilytica]|uniref:Type II secretion system F family protein n=1 Tax=Oricola cellulosilytica TaxID=1429082 RepID=A0A4R0PIG3_9HYPH|nr:type II secretion system F family protein [Oricola cellulosilytica]TCD16748.1 type II secretion system F family protein [Oricola cellulosilytica]
MFGLPVSVVAMIALAGLAAGGVLYALFLTDIENEQKKKRRLANIRTQKTDTASRKAVIDRASEGAKRKKQIQDSLSELEERNAKREQGATRPSLKQMLTQAGLRIDTKQFYLYSVVSGAALSLLMAMVGVPFLYLVGVFFVGTVGVPRWAVGFLRNRRMKAFLNEFPNAIDVIVRAIKSGLPLNDGLRLIAAEAREPVKAEFRRIVEAQQLGLSTPEACGRMYQSMPLPEANFFAIVIQIQASAGGNLAEALGNLSRVLRDRKKMKAKVAAMSMEAKASAAIIAALPFIVTGLVYLTSPAYIMLLFTTNTGYMILGVSAVWMAIGVFVMRQMINFEV